MIPLRHLRRRTTGPAASVARSYARTKSPARQAWDLDFDGGSSSSLIFPRANGDSELVRVIRENPFIVRWEIALYDQETLENLWQSKGVENAYDAFWPADALLSGDKFPEDIDDILRWTIPPFAGG